MSALTEQLTGGHVFAWGPTTDGGAVPSCTCQPGVRVDDWPAHLIAVTESVVQAQIASSITEYADRDVPCWRSPAVRDVVLDTFTMSARIARDGES